MGRNFNSFVPSTRAAGACLLFLAILDTNVLAQTYRVCDSSLTGGRVAPMCADSDSSECPALSACISDTEPVVDTCIDYCEEGETLLSLSYTAGSSYQTCSDNSECNGCCAFPHSKVVVATPSEACGPKSCSGCEDCDCNKSILQGICVGGTDASLPGYSCDNKSPCESMKSWLYQRCGYSDNENWQTFLPRRRCTQTCARAMSKLRECPNLATFFEVADNTVSQCEGCVNYDYQTCQSSNDCDAGFCCGLPTAGNEVTSGPPSSCTCNSETGEVSCVDTTAGASFGVCQEIGAVNQFNENYQCDCEAPRTEPFGPSNPVTDPTVPEGTDETPSPAPQGDSQKPIGTRRPRPDNSKIKQRLRAMMHDIGG